MYKIDLTGRRFTKLVVTGLAESTRKNVHDRYWWCHCDCGGEDKKVRQAHLLRGKIQSCGCFQFRKGKDHKQWKGCGEMAGAFFGIIRHGAKTRRLDFQITPTEIWELFIRQDRKCALTGLALTFSTLSGGNDGTASLDRIDASRGYVMDNVQWVHKDINMMKQALTTEKFKYYCRMVSEIAETEYLKTLPA